MINILAIKFNLNFKINCFDEDKNDMSPIKKTETLTVDDRQQEYKCE